MSEKIADLAGLASPVAILLELFLNLIEITFINHYRKVTRNRITYGLTLPVYKFV